MFSWKKLLLASATVILASALFFVIGMFLLTLDPKDRCLDAGGRYQPATHTCEKGNL